MASSCSATKINSMRKHTRRFCQKLREMGFLPLDLSAVFSVPSPTYEDGSGIGFPHSGWSNMRHVGRRQEKCHRRSIAMQRRSSPAFHDKFLPLKRSLSVEDISYSNHILPMPLLLGKMKFKNYQI